MRRIFAFAILLCCTVSGQAAAKECTKFEAYAAETLYPYLSSCKEMHMAYRAYGHCDDGAIAEAFDEAISVLWEKHWELVPEMVTETAADIGFKQFVFKRVGSETIPMKRWEIILKMSRRFALIMPRSFVRKFWRPVGSNRSPIS